MISQNEINRPWGVHTIRNIYDPNCDAGLPDGRWVAAVAEPYTENRIVAAWWVLTGRAYALIWPKAGDLEDIFNHKKPENDVLSGGLVGGQLTGVGQVQEDRRAG